MQMFLNETPADDKDNMILWVNDYIPQNTM